MSWAMEELLEPWVHYVPLKDDLLGVKMQMRWILNHEDEAQQITYFTTLWMYDLAMHPDAKRENQLICRTMLKQNRSLFIKAKDGQET